MKSPNNRRNSSNSGGNLASRNNSFKSFDQAAGATKGLRRFGQSIKRVVREVKEAEASVGESRTVLVSQNTKYSHAIKLLNECCLQTLTTLVTLHNKYLRSKEVTNIFNRYALMREMIKEAVRMESQWWALIEVPPQNRAESTQAYVLRVCSVIERVRVPISDEAFQESDAEKEARIERVNEMTSKQVHEDNEVLSNTTFKLLKKYQGIRSIVKTLANDYGESKFYPMFPRYNILKDMIKDVTHHPDYMEHQHESRVKPD